MLKLNKILDMVIVSLIAIVFGLSWVPEKDIDKELQRYYNEFNTLVQIGCSNPNLRNPGRLTVHFSNELTGTTVGQCRVFVNTSEIKIDNKYWYSAPDSRRYQVVMHELTHCLYGSWYSAKYPFHVSNPDHYMYYQVSDLSITDIQEQIINVSREECND